jgi:hypothetical protein
MLYRDLARMLGIVAILRFTAFSNITPLLGLCTIVEPHKEVIGVSAVLFQEI